MLKKIQMGCGVGFFGLGKSNLSLLNNLPLNNCKITIRSDTAVNRNLVPPGARLLEGKKALCDIDETIIFFSPSVRRERTELQFAKDKGVIFSSDAEMFFEANRKPIFAISGSDGKSTTATLTNLLLCREGFESRLIGNVGEPMYAELGKGKVYVAELSSFMLRYYAPKVKRGCITNITPNHLDWHRSFAEYRKTKLSLINSSEEFVITDELLDISGAYGIISNTRDFRDLRRLYEAEVYLTLEKGWILRNGERLLEIDKIQKNEPHNIKNLMMAIAITDGFVANDSICSVAESFSGLKHRCERFYTKNGVDFYDSSIDTTPARTAETLLSLGRRTVVILGGKSKGLDYGEMLPALKKYAAATVIYGESRKEIYSSLTGEVCCYIANDFKSAVELGASLSRDVGALILSPAATSYDSFSDYRQRGNTFKRIIFDLHKGD